MELVSTENGWEAQTGSATFKNEGSKAVAMLDADFPRSGIYIAFSKK